MMDRFVAMIMLISFWSNADSIPKLYAVIVVIAYCSSSVKKFGVIDISSTRFDNN